MNHKHFLSEAKIAEAEGNIQQASVLYEQLLKEDPQNETVLHRLMILYRKLKKPAKEIGIINKAIKILQQHYTPQKKLKGIVADLSKKINLTFGLTDKKGNQRLPEEIEKLEKRKALVQNKFSK